MGCYICERKPPKLVTRSHRRLRSLVLLVRFAQPAELRLRKMQAFFFAQDDMLIVCFAPCVRFWRDPSKLRFAAWQICFAKIAPALPKGGSICKNSVHLFTFLSFYGIMESTSQRHAKKILAVAICVSFVVLLVLVYNTAIHIDVYMDILFRRI